MRFLGDCKSDISLIHPEAFRQNIRTIDLLGPDFVVFLGDFVKGDTGEAVLEMETSNWNRDIHPLLAEHQVELVFAGHWHLYQRPVAKDGVKYIVTAGGGSPLRTGEIEGGFYHWVHVVVKGEEVKLAVIRPEGVLSEEGIPLPRWEQLGWIQRKSFGAAFVDASRQVPFAEKIIVKARNPLELSVYGNIRWSCPEGWEVLPKSRGHLIEPRSEVGLAFEVKAEKGVRLTYPLPGYEATLSWEGNGPPIATGRRGLRLRRRLICRRTKRKIRIGGKLDDWEGLEPLLLDRKDQVVGPWGGPDDLSAQVYLAWDEEYLYFAAMVRDDRFFQVVVNDNDGQGPKTWIGWTPGIRESKDTSFFGELSFE